MFSNLAAALTATPRAISGKENTDSELYPAVSPRPSSFARNVPKYSPNHKFGTPKEPPAKARSVFNIGDDGVRAVITDEKAKDERTRIDGMTVEELRSTATILKKNVLTDEYCERLPVKSLYAEIERVQQSTLKVKWQGEEFRSELKRRVGKDGHNSLTFSDRLDAELELREKLAGLRSINVELAGSIGKLRWDADVHVRYLQLEGSHNSELTSVEIS